MELPIEFENRMKKLLGAEYPAFAEALQNESPVKGLRVNTNKASVESFVRHAPFPLQALDYVREGFIVSDTAQAGKHPYHHAGAYYMQDPGAMATVAALPSEVLRKEKCRILDVCAAPGGKTTQLASLAAERGGVVLANEYNAARSRILAGNVERMGLSNVCVTNLDSKYLAEWYPSFFDLVLVDAPCSGEGMYRKNDLAISEWSPQNVEMCAVRQKEILERAACCVAHDGYLLYSTCTYSKEENEEIVAAFLDTHPAFSLCPVSPSVTAHTADGIDVTGGRHPELALCRRFYPHLSQGEGQFLALLRREEEGCGTERTVRDSFATLGKSELAVADSFLKETLGKTVSGLGLCGGNAVLFPSREAVALPIPPFGVISVGVTLGEIRKGRLVPHHHFFTAYGTDFLSRQLLDADSDAVTRYLGGEEIAAEDGQNGFTALLLRLGEECVSLGGSKASGGRLKNYYPKGLRVR